MVFTYNKYFYQKHYISKQSLTCQPHSSHEYTPSAYFSEVFGLNDIFVFVCNIERNDTVRSIVSKRVKPLKSQSPLAKTKARKNKKKSGRLMTFYGFQNVMLRCPYSQAGDNRDKRSSKPCHVYPPNLVCIVHCERLRIVKYHIPVSNSMVMIGINFA